MKTCSQVGTLDLLRKRSSGSALTKTYIPLATMKQDLIQKWLYTIDLEYPTLERPSKRRRVDQEGPDSESQPTIGLVNPWLRRSKSDGCLVDNKAYETSAIAQISDISRSLRLSPPGSVASIGCTRKPLSSVQAAVTDYKTSTGSKQVRIDVIDSNYRSDVLASNRIIFSSATTPLPASVIAAVENSVFKQGFSEMHDLTATQIRDNLIQLGEDAETDLRQGFMAMGILPSKAAGKTLKRVQRMPFSNAVLPRVTIPYGLSAAIQAICEAKPDVAYGYTLQAFTPTQQITQRSTVNGEKLSRFSRLAKDLYWPFFIVEFSALAVGGNIYFAENQCAGGGSAFLLASQTLQSVAPLPDDFADTMSFVTYSAARYFRNSFCSFCVLKRILLSRPDE